MTDSLIARLRNPYWVYGEDTTPHDERWRKDRDEAANEIERLQAKLKESEQRRLYGEAVIVKLAEMGDMP